jgi:DNA-binding transcriptional regulator LsrR (DeoR family)
LLFPFRIVVAATAEKTLSLCGALRGDYVHALVTDVMAACGALDILRDEFQTNSS